MHALVIIAGYVSLNTWIPAISPQLYHFPTADEAIMWKRIGIRQTYLVSSRQVFVHIFQHITQHVISPVLAFFTFAKEKLIADDSQSEAIEAV